MTAHRTKSQNTYNGSVRITCLVCRHETSRNVWKKHRCTGPWFDHPDYDVIVKYCKNKKTSMRSKRFSDDFFLTALEVKQMLDDAGITIHDVGIYAGNYVLGRYKDTGDYIVGNCRFITQEQNAYESHITKARIGKTRSMSKVKQQKWLQL